MASRYWIKLYHEILDDPKMGRLPDALFRRAIELFLIAGENGRDGGLPALADIAWRLRADEIELDGADGGPGGAEYPEPGRAGRMAGDAFREAPGAFAGMLNACAAAGKARVVEHFAIKAPVTKM